MVEVSEGVYLQGKEVEEYCLQRGRCTICAKTKVRRKVVKVFGSNTWEPITAVKVPRTNSANNNANPITNKHTESKQRGFRGKRNKKNSSTNNNYDAVKAKIESGKDDNDLEYLVYKGYCLREGCYTLDQAKRLVDCSNKSGIGSTRSGLPAATRRNSNAKSNSNSSFGSSHKSLVSNSNSNKTNSNTNSINNGNNSNSNSKKRGKQLFNKGLFRRSPKSTASTSTTSNNNPFFTPPKNDKYPLLKIVGEASPIQIGSILSPLSAAGISPSTPNGENLSATSEKVSSTITGEISHLATEHDKNNNNNNSSNNETKYETESDFEKIFETTVTAHSSVVPSPQVRQNYKHEFWVDSPKKKNQNRDLYQVDSGDTGERPPSKQQSQQLPVREIVEKTISALQGLSSNPSSPVIHTLDLTGLRFRKSEMEAMAKLFRAGKNGTVHLTSLVLDNCGIDDKLLWILGQALYDALWTANKTMIGNTKQKVSKSMRHAKMRLKSLSLGDNGIGKDGIQNGLCPYLESIACELENLDLSRNRIDTKGGVTLFNALRRNPQTKIRTIDLSCNLLQDPDDQNLDVGEQQQQKQKRNLSPNGQLSGIHGFLSKNRTLKELDLSSNRMTDDGVEALFRGLSLAGDKTVLEKLNLGFNRIGDRGAVAISICLVSNKSLVHLELNDNHIQNDGGESIVSAMEHNTTLKEIAGLWSNQIDKRSIIVSIRQLLVSDDRGKTKNSKQNIFGRVPNATGGSNRNQEDDSDSDVDLYITSDSDSTQSKSTRSTVQTRNGTGKKLSVIEEGPNHSEENPNEDGKDNISDYFNVEDNGNVSDLSDHEEEDLSESYESLLREKSEGSDMEAVDGLMETNQEVTHNMFDRMTIMNSSPLVCFDDKENDTRRGINLHDTKLETEAIKTALETHQHTRGSRIDIREEMATPDKFKAFFSGCDSSMLHISCHGDKDGLALEDGYGSLEMMSLDSLKELVSGGTARGGDTLGLVFVSSPRARNIGQAFLDAGVKHVVCCQRDDAFRDPLALEFMESFYKHAAQKETLRESFKAGLRTAVSSPLSKNLCRVANRFHLLPLSLPEPSAPIFFKKFVPHHDKEQGEEKEKPWGNGDDALPPLPDHFVGREIEMFKILEALQVADSVEISGSPGCGKECVLAVSLEYALKRKEMFSIDHICWIPAPKYTMVDPDSLYGDLVLCYELIRDSEEDLWDRSEEVLDCRERLAVELEGAKVVVVIDNRSFTSRGSRASLEKLVNFIVTYTSTAKVVCISSPAATNETEASDYSAIKTSCIEIDALPFRSTVRLFGEISGNVSRSNEFLEVTDVPFVSHTKDSSSVGGSKRRSDIFELMGKGFPTEVIASAKGMSENGFHELMKIVNKPEIRIDSLSELESEVRRWDIFVKLSIKDRNFNRSVEWQATINELDGMRQQFSSLKDLKAKEKSMKLELANAVSNRRYDVANELKRDLLALKKKIIKERRVSNNPKAILNDLKFQADSLAETIDLDESLQEEIKSFDVDCDGHTCMFLIYSGSVYDPKSYTCSSYPNDEDEEQLKSKCLGIVCWSNEACALETTPDGKALLDFNADRFKECVADIPIVEETKHGSVRCLMGNSLILNPESSALVIDTGSDSLEKMVGILTVGPFAGPSGQIDALLERDKDYHRFGMTTLRSCYRTCVEETNRANLQTLVIRPLTTRTKNGPIYEEFLKVAVQTVVEDAKFSTGLREVHLVGKSPKEATLLAGIMKTLGYSFRIEETKQPIILTTMASI